MKNTLTIPAETLRTMMDVGHRKLLVAKNIIIEENEISYILLAESYNGEKEIAAHATKPRSVLQGTNGGG